MTTQTASRMPLLILSAALCDFMREFDAFMENQDLYPDDLAESRRVLMEAFDGAAI